MATLQDYVTAGRCIVLAGADRLEDAVAGHAIHRAGAGGPPTGAGPGDRVVVVEWGAPGRGALPDLAELLIPVLAAVPAAVLVLTGGRTLRPPPDVVDLVDRAGAALMWAAPSTSVADLEERVARVAPSESELSQLGRGLGDLLARATDVHGVAAVLAGHLGARVVVTDAGGRPLAAAPPESDGDGAVAGEWPLEEGGRVVGRLVVQRGRPLCTVEQLTVRGACRVAALLVRLEELRGQHTSPAEQLLAAIIGDDLRTRESAVRRARRTPEFPRQPVVFVVVLPFTVQASAGSAARLRGSVLAAVRELDPQALLVVHEGVLVLVVAADSELDRLPRLVVRQVSAPVVLGASSPVAVPRSFASAHREAERAAVIARQLGLANRVTRYSALGPMRLLFQIPERERASFAHEVLGPLAGGDTTAVEARRILRSFRASNGNVMESARHLFLHHNTLRLRLARLEEQLGPFTRDATVRQSVFMALDLHQLDHDRDI